VDRCAWLWLPLEIEQTRHDEAEQVRLESLNVLRQQKIKAIETNVIFAIAAKFETPA
jgi:hypothetical protein